MSDTLAPLIRDFLTWVALRPRPYGEVMEHWRTSCPRLTVWEDAVDAGLIDRETKGGVLMVRLSDRGRSFLGTT